LLKVQNFQVIIFYLLLVNIILFALTIRALNINPLTPKKNNLPEVDIEHSNINIFSVFVIFIIVSLIPFFGSFGLQFGTVIIFCIAIKSKSFLKRILLYLPLLIMFVIFNHDNKREVILMTFAILALDSLFSKEKFKIDIKNSSLYIVAISLLVTLVTTSSILRGYGGYGDVNFFKALSLVPKYIGSDNFIDSIIDNFEVSSVYPSVVLSIEYIETGRLSLIYGESLIKPLFLPIPRDFFPSKPESIITIFTREQSPHFLLRGGSLPVAFPGELFINFHFFSLFILLGIVSFFNYIFSSLKNLPSHGLLFKISSAASLLIFIFIRGGGLDLYTISLLSSFIIIVLSSLKSGFKIRI
jgi:hypothetical protein